MKIKLFLSQAWLSAKVQQGGISFTEFVAYRVGVSILTLFLYVLTARHASNAIDLTPWVMGNAFALCLYECIFGIGGTFSTERFTGRLRIIVVSPTSKLEVLMYKGVSSICVSAITIVLSFVIGSLVFGVSFDQINSFAFLAAVLTAAFACVGLGLLMSVFALITDSLFLVLNALALILMIFSGANFPLEQLPLFAQRIAVIFPLHRSIAAANLSMSEYIPTYFFRLLITELSLGVLFFLLAFLTIGIVEKISIKRASLEMF